MSTNKLQYDDESLMTTGRKSWRKIYRDFHLKKKLHLVFSLVMFLQMNVMQLLKFIFTSEIKDSVAATPQTESQFH